MGEFGVSLSVKQCRNFKIEPLATLKWLIKDCGFQRFRLMGYWDELEPARGEFDFKALDAQIKLITKSKGSVSLCLGARQPRWPENHWPGWAWQLSHQERTKALLNFLEIVVRRYRGNKSVISYQLENEALLKSFGERSEVDRHRLRREFALVKQLDQSKPVIMSTSTSWGIPLRRPIPDIVGFSYYQVHFNAKKNAYSTAYHKVWLHRFRALLIKIIWRRPGFIHELQLEPWGPKNIWDMSLPEQMKSMNPQQIAQNIKIAKGTDLQPIDLWGAEWWYWLNKHHDDLAIINSVLKAIEHPLLTK